MTILLADFDAVQAISTLGLPTVLLLGLLYVIWAIGRFFVRKVVAKMVNDEGTGLFQRWVQAHLDFVNSVQKGLEEQQKLQTEEVVHRRKQSDVLGRVVEIQDKCVERLDAMSKQLNEVHTIVVLKGIMVTGPVAAPKPPDLPV